MKTTFKIVLVIITGFVLTMSTACSQKKVQFFHGGYPDFRPGPPGGADLVEIKEGVDFKAYKTIILDAASFHFESGAQYNVISPLEMKELREAFHKAFVDALKGAYPLVKQPRPDALRVRVVILNVVPLIQDASSDVPFSVGGASIKAEFLDSMTNERLGAVMDTKTGYKNKAVKSMDEWEHTKDVFKFWAQRLRNWLDTTHGK
jgi:hypothetical protein